MQNEGPNYADYNSNDCFEIYSEFSPLEWQREVTRWPIGMKLSKIKHKK